MHRRLTALGACRSALVLVILAALGMAGSSPPARARGGDLSDLSLEELMQIQLDRLSVTAIHHTHDAGDWMVGITTMFMRRVGNRDGTSDLGSGDVLAQGYTVSPNSMDMQSYMLHPMGAPTDDLTLFLIMPYVRKSTDHRTAMGARFATDSAGPGHLRLTGL